MPTINNKTRKPMSVPLPGGKTLHLGPGKSGQVSPKALGHPRLKQLVEDGELEILDEDHPQTNLPGGDKMGRPSTSGRHGGSSIRRTGDR